MEEKFNKYINKEDYYELIVNNSSSIFKIDKEDYIFAKDYVWVSIKHIINGNTFEYLVTYIMDTNKGIRTQMSFYTKIMEKLILQYKLEHNYNKQIIVDHINGDTTDNRKHNLRVRTQSENNMNKAIQCNNTSGIVGVSWNKDTQMWTSHIAINKKRIRIGSFYYLRNAVKSRIKSESKYFGEHAFINRDENYQKLINDFLSLENKEEPFIWSITYGEKLKLYIVVISCPSKNIKISTSKCRTKELAQDFVNDYIKDNPNNVYIEKSKKTIKNI